jgi:uncharacterized membrane protein
MTEFYYELLLLAGLAVIASVAGVLALYSSTIMPGLKKLDDATFVSAFKAIDRRIVQSVFMVQFFAPVFLVGAAAMYAFVQNAENAPLVSGAFACYLGVVAVTIGVNVPLNDGIKRTADALSSSEAAAARTQFNEKKWVAANHARLALSLLSAGLLAAALL